METVEDILRKMRVECDHSDMVCFGEGGEVYLDALADRFEAAYKRDLQSMCEAGERDMQTAANEVARLKKQVSELCHFGVCRSEKCSCCEIATEEIKE